MPRLTSKKKIEEYAEYFGETFLESYFHLVDMGEIKESESLRNWAANLWIRTEEKGKENA